MNKIFLLLITIFLTTCFTTKTIATPIAVLSEHTLPESVDLREYCSPIECQWNTDACTAFATVGALEVLENKQGVKKFQNLSRLFLYYNSRTLEGTQAEDAGAKLSSVMQSLNTNGICYEKYWNFYLDKVTTKPAPVAYDHAKCHPQGCQLLNYSDMYGCLAAGYPVVFEAWVFNSFAYSTKGKIPMPYSGDSFYTQHCMVAVGYTKDVVIVRNSWSQNWGDLGYCYIPRAYFEQSIGLVKDMWFFVQFPQS